MVALGNFDGVHLGHQQVICPTVAGGPDPRLDLASLEYVWGIGPGISGWSDRQPDTPTSDRFPEPTSPLATVVTFYPHPQEFFSGAPRPWLTPLGEKALLLKALGVEQLVLLPFRAALAHLTPGEFVEQVLLRGLQAQSIHVGADFRFGRDRAGTVDTLAALAPGVAVTQVPLLAAGGDRISSSRIRQALWAGDLATTRQLLGRPFAIAGRVVPGQQLGRKLGFPTANLALWPDKVLPRNGVYAVWVRGIPGQGDPQPGVMNLGVRPTVDGQRQTLEVHLLGWQGTLYGATLTVTLEAFLRPEHRFDSITALQAQIHQDCHQAAALLLSPSPPSPPLQTCHG